MHHPADVFEVAVVKERSAVELHPRTQLLCTHGADLWQHVAVDTHTHVQRETHTHTQSCDMYGLLKVQNDSGDRVPCDEDPGGHRYLLRNTPLKMVSMMLSISDRFSCSCKRNQYDDGKGIAAASNAFKNVLNIFCNIEYPNIRFYI